MKISILIAFCFFMCLISPGQTQLQQIKIDTTVESEKFWSKWLSDLYEVGVVMEKDSIRINDEARLIIMDSNFRKLIYPEVYTWQTASFLLKKMELKKGFWYLINLYSEDTANKKLVIETLMTFDQLMDMEKIMVSTFYTYALLNPKTSNIKNGKSIIARPDLIEKQFGIVKEIIQYISYYRKTKKAG